MDLFDKPHRRYNPLKDEWVLVSPQRNRRPWLGQLEPNGSAPEPSYNPGCYLCPTNQRANGLHNPDYEYTFVFDNDFPALLPTSPTLATDDPLFRVTGERGLCRVVCFSPRHNASLADLSQPAVRRVVDEWIAQTIELGTLDTISYVQVFENRGAAMGASNPHPHCQIWGTEHIPSEPAHELANLTRYRAEHASCLLCDYGEKEAKLGERIVAENEHFIMVVPFWATWPFETLLLSRRHVGSLPELQPSERDALAEIIRRLTATYDRVFQTAFPYSMGFHQAPTDGHEHPEAHLHAHYYPPLLRSASIRKFMVGFELLASPQRDLTPEDAAERLRQANKAVKW